MELLTELLGYKGRLKIITSDPDPDRAPECTPLRPSYFILHDVVRIEGVRGRRTVKAYSEEGDECSGYPVPLLSRLTEWKMERKEPVDAVGI